MARRSGGQGVMWGQWSVEGGCDRNDRHQADMSADGDDAKRRQDDLDRHRECDDQRQTGFLAFSAA